MNQPRVLTPTLPPTLAPSLALLVTAALLPAQVEESTPAVRPIATINSTEIAGGKVAVLHFPVAMRAASLESIQARGTVWSMGDREAAGLETTVALAYDKTVIPPGRYRMSTWFKRRGEWALLIFARGKNYRSGTPYFEVPLRIRELDQPSAAVKLAVSERRGRLRLELFGGTTRLRAEFSPLAILRREGTVLGRPATYEFYIWPAAGAVQNRLRNLEPVVFGRILDQAPFGFVYDLTCRSDGNGVFIDARTTSLREHQTLLQETHKQRQETPDDPALGKRQAALEQAIAVQETLQPTVMVAASVAMKKTSAPILDVTFTENETRSFDLAFGIRRVTFTISDTQFRRLSWK